MENITKIVQNQKKFFNTNYTIPVEFRKKQLKKLKQLLVANEQNLYKAIFADFKKSEFDTYTTELSLVYHEIDLALKKLSHWAKPKKVATNIVNLPSKSIIVAEPYGTCTIIGAWNYPIQLCLVPVIGAIAAGNTVILKPSELTTNTSNELAKIINTNFESNYLYVMQGGVAETTELLAENVDFIFFTGSNAVGKIVYKAAAQNLTPTVLELGGKSPAIISQHCHLNLTVKRLIWAKFLNSGQTCIAPDFAVVHKSIFKDFIKLCAAEIKKAKYSFDNQNYVQIINNKHFTRLTNLMHEGKIEIGGNTNKADRFIEPTIISGLSYDSKIMQEEIFGPILPILTYSNFEELISTLKTKEKPLACYLFSKNKKEKETYKKELSFGGGAINDAVMHITNSKLPFGGVGGSGIGKYHGEHSFNTFSHSKSILKKLNWFELPLKFSPISELKLKTIKFLMKL